MSVLSSLALGRVKSMPAPWGLPHAPAALASGLSAKEAVVPQGTFGNVGGCFTLSQQEIGRC